MSGPNLYDVHDGETLRKNSGGLEIVRRQKHEWVVSLNTLSSENLVRKTGKVWGSKFFVTWTLPALVDWIESVVIEERWTLYPGHAYQANRTLEETIGLAAGYPTRKIRIVCDGRYVHAYPVQE